MCETCTIKGSFLKKNSIVYHAAGTEKYDFSKFYINYTVEHWKNSFYCSLEGLAKSYLFVNDGAIKCSSNEEKPFLHKIEVKRDIEFLISYCSEFKKGSVSKQYLPENMVAILKKHDILPSAFDKTKYSFMAELGKKGYAFRCYHDTDGNWELIIPYHLMKADNFKFVSCQKFSSFSEVNAAQKEDAASNNLEMSKIFTAPFDTRLY